MICHTGDVDIGGFACFYLLYFWTELCNKSRNQVGLAVDLHPNGQYTLLCTGWGPVCLETVRWSRWFSKFSSIFWFTKTNPGTLKVKPQNHFTPSSPKFISYLIKTIPNVLFSIYIFYFMLDSLSSVPLFLGAS